MDTRLLGQWESDPEDLDSIRRYGRVGMRFDPDGSLEYRFEDGAVSRLAVESAEAGTMVTNQPSAPRREETRYAFDDEGHLVLRRGGVESRYRRNPVR